MESKSPLSTAPSTSTIGHIVTIKFALHPLKNLRISLHTHVATNPHTISTQTAALPVNNGAGDRFAVIDAQRVFGITHLGTAANSALLRLDNFHRLSSNSATETATPRDNSTRKRRGAALETVLCAGGSTNVGSVLKDFTFDRNSIAASDAGMDSVESTERRYDVLFLGYDCVSDAEFTDALSSVGLDLPVDECGWTDYFARERDEKELQEFAKLFKISPEELIRDDFSLEKAVLNRVAVKYSI